jgi:hypothetical protein
MFNCSTVESKPAFMLETEKENKTNIAWALPPHTAIVITAVKQRNCEQSIWKDVGQNLRIYFVVQWLL